MSILLLSATKLNSANPLASILHSLTTPIQVPLTYTRQQKDQLANFLFQTPSLLSENTKLKNEVGSLKILLKKYQEELNDQALIKELGKTDWQQIQPVRLVTFDNLITFTSRNFEDIVPGQPVVSGNSLIGLVKSVNAPIIMVTPLQNTDLTIPAQLETGAKGHFVYQNNEPSIVNLDSSTIFNPRTLVFTLPSAQIPENLVIGRINKITSAPANPTAEATLTLDRQVNTSSNFFVITKP